MDVLLPDTATRLDRLKAGNATISGGFEPAFEPVVAAFAKNFEDGLELGAAAVVYHRGRPVVDVWGGVRDTRTGALWDADTRSLVFSVSKGLLSICLGMLADRGLLEFDRPVADYWPEFAAAGKSKITVSQLMNHTAGLPYLTGTLTQQEILSWTPVADALAAQAPLWAPGSEVFYHGQTIGWLGGELVRRISGLRTRAFFEHHVAMPLGLRAGFGAAASEIPSLARHEPAPPERDPHSAALLELQYSDERVDRMLTLNGLLPFPRWQHRLSDTYNSTQVLTAELPAVNFVTSAHDLARAYAAVIRPGDEDPLIRSSTLAEMTRWLSGGGLQRNFSPNTAPNRWGVGFMVPAPPHRPLLGPGSFGHDGAGGQLGVANINTQIALGYTNNQMGGVLDQRANELCRALSSVRVSS